MAVFDVFGMAYVRLVIRRAGNAGMVFRAKVGAVQASVAAMHRPYRC